MFKKSLLALSVAGATFAANAGILSASIDESGDIRTAAAAAAGAATDCATFAATYGAVVDLNGNTVDAAVNDTITVAAHSSGTTGTDGIYDTANNTMVYTGDDACTLTVNADQLVAASSVANSLEGAQANGVTVSATLVTGIGGVTDEDTITITVSGGVVDEDASASATLTGGNDGTPSTFTLIGVVGNKILFTVDAGQQVGREILSIAGVVVTPDSDVTELSLAAETQNTANVVYDTTDSEKITVLEAQYSSAVDYGFDGIIDVATDRIVFEANSDDSSGAAEAVTADSLVIEITEETTQGNLLPESVTFDIMGDFSWMAQLDTSDDDTAITSAELLAGVAIVATDANGAADDTANATAAINGTYDKLTLVVPTNTDDDPVDGTYTITWNVPAVGTGETSLNEQTFVVDVKVTDEDAANNAGFDAVVGDDLAGGAWTLNGSVVKVPYIPFGPNTQPIIRHTNDGVQTGDISVRYMVEGTDTTWQDLGVVMEDAEPGVHNLLDPIQTALEAALGTDKFKVTLEITTNVPGEDVTVFAAAKITAEGQDRLTIGAFGANGH